MSKDTRLIGICGPARAGKDTFANNLSAILIHTVNEDYSDYVVARESFAAPIKSMIAMFLDFFGFGSIMNPSTLEPYIEGELKEEVLDNVGVSPRKLMQTIGTDWGRNMIDKDLWLNSMKSRIAMYAEAKEHGHKGAFVFVTDVRFDNEAHMIKELGGTIVKIITTRDIDEVQDHVTEQGISDFLVDTIIENNGTPEDFKQKAVVYIEALLDAKLEDITAPVIPLLEESDSA